MRRDSFERFYYEKIGLGEGCGCAEHVTRIRELDALAHKGFPRGPASRPLRWLRRLMRRVVRSAV